jgi:hypothetical protein
MPMNITFILAGKNFAAVLMLLNALAKTNRCAVHAAATAF